MEPFCAVLPTSYGGRGVFATQKIPKGTAVHTCPGPFASVIYRVFRREVCAQCFLYAFDVGRNTWNVKNDSQPGSGVWFCGEECRDAWIREENFDGLVGEINIVVDKAMKRMKVEESSEEVVQGIADNIVNWRLEDITAEVIDRAWKDAEAEIIKPGTNDVQFLEELELDTARFLLSGIIQRAREDNKRTERTDAETRASSSPWSALLELQNNEVHYIREKPYMLAAHLRVYRFLRQIAIPALRPYITTSETVRSILGRDPGNVFGIWDASTSGDSEMLGWGIYISASYFNHDCEPNVKKLRASRSFEFVTLRDVEPGEELCINYIDLKDHVTERRSQLEKHWYFSCNCKRCEKELGVAAPNSSSEAGDSLDQPMQNNGQPLTDHGMDEKIVPDQSDSQ
ncbi:hypothetical protein AX16_003307 [Volvariella volvacea WC 439]|nr:hypothetical protein AX16_003307 [Volvariella volvacea WC 439]